MQQKYNFDFKNDKPELLNTSEKAAESLYSWKPLSRATQSEKCSQNAAAPACSLAEERTEIRAQNDGGCEESVS